MAAQNCVELERSKSTYSAKMFLTYVEIYDWTKKSPSHPIFIGGRRILQAGNIVKIGIKHGNESDDCLNLTALCLQKSHLEISHYEVNGRVRKNGKIVSMNCSCESNSEEICEHIAAILIHCCEFNVESIQPQRKSHLGEKVERLVRQPPAKKCKIDLVENENSANLPAMKKKIEMRGPVLLPSQSENKMADVGENAMKIIFDEQESELMRKIENMEVKSPADCCKRTLESLAVDCLKVCVDTKKSTASWHKERRFRITGTSCYKLATYVKNKNPNWKKKCSEFLNPKSISNEYTDYGIRMESRARDAFKKATNKTVFETGLVVSKQNPWLACSPDGVVFDNGKPSMLLEIKCPINGQWMSVDRLKEDQVGKCLTKDKDGNYSMKKRHTYYGQVQLGMAVLNVKETAFVLYSDFEKKVCILTVPFDDTFVTDMLTGLKNMYYSIMVHEICMINGRTQKRLLQSKNHQLWEYNF